MPFGYEVDFDALPAAKAVGYYEFTVVIGIDEHQDIKNKFGVGAVGPDKLAELFDRSDDLAWWSSRVGNRITLYTCNGYRVSKVSVVGDGPKPAVRPVWTFPKEQKN
jgi:hypothetical protein